jgi:peptidoglycan-associated lipoprotein
MKNIWLGLAVVLAAALLLGGCGGAETKAPAPAAKEEAAKPAPSAAPPAAVTPPPAKEAPPPVAKEPPPPEPKVAEPKEMDVEPKTEKAPPVAVVEPPPIEEPPQPRAVEQAPPPAVAEQAPVDRPIPVVEAPPQPVAAAPEFAVVYFDFDKYNIKPEFDDVIRHNAEQLTSKGLSVLVEGHCDERGTTEYNLALGQRRAKAVRDALVQRGVDAGRLEIVSYGEERPVAMGHDEGSWSQNRRSVLTTK